MSTSVGICTSVFGHRDALTPAKLHALAASGVEWIEIAALQSQHLNVFDDERIGDLIAALRRTPLKVWSFHAPFCALAMDDPETRSDALRRLLRAAAVARRFGAGRVVVHPGRDVPSRDRAREVAWTREGLARAAEELPETVAVAMETVGRTSIGGPPEEMLALLDGLDPARAGICMDTGHVNNGGDVLGYIAAVAGRIITVHLHDNHGDRDAHDLPGEGNIDWPATLAALRASGYAGPLMGECDHPALPPVEVASEFRRRILGYADDS